jgi:fatty acid desaturase
MWEIYGNKYDLTHFIEIHPGGSHIIEQTKNKGDITILFETYHAFSDMENIQKLLEKYRINTIGPKQSSTYCYSHFDNYRDLVAKVREKYPDISSVKTSWQQVVFHLLQVFFFIGLLYATYFSSLSFPLKILTQTGYSICESSLILFHGFHQGSHYAISIYPDLNYWIYKFSASWLLLNTNIWTNQHIHKHHTSTERDHMMDEYSIWNINLKNIMDEIDIPDIVIYYYTIFQGQYVTQCILHFTKILEYIFIHNKHTCIIDPIDVFILTSKLILLYRVKWIFTLIHLIIMNISYFIYIEDAHDYYGPIQIKGHGKDWSKTQISNRVNLFGKNTRWMKWTGSINYQIEHRLFPNVNYIHLPYISLSDKNPIE